MCGAIIDNRAMETFKDLVSYLDEAEIFPGTYSLNFEDSSPVSYKYVSFRVVFYPPCLK